MMHAAAYVERNIPFRNEALITFCAILIKPPDFVPFLCHALLSTEQSLYVKLETLQPPS